LIAAFLLLPVGLVTLEAGAADDRLGATTGGASTMARATVGESHWERMCARRRSAGRRAFVRPGQDLARLIARRPAGTTFCVRSGIHRFRSPVVPKARTRFVGEPGAVWSGARVITGRFVPAGRLWVANGMAMEGEGEWAEPEPCGAGGGRLCLRTNEVFLDGRWLRRVGSRSELSAGEFFFDYERDRIYLANDPRGATVEVGVVPQALRSFRTGATGVRVHGLVIEKFATPANFYAVEGKDGWVLDGVEIRLNHACGATAQILRKSVVHDNGQCGFSTADNDGAIVEDNEFFRNHRTSISGWHTAAVKILRSRNAIVRRNHVHDEDSIGLWTDWDNVGTLYEGNRIERTGGPGIFHEASCGAVIRGNTVRRAGYAREFAGWIDGSGILVQTSRNVLIHGNIVLGSRHGIGATSTRRGTGTNCGEFVTHNLRAFDNTVVVGAGSVAAGVAGIVTQPFTAQAFYNRNRYVVCSAARFSGPSSLRATTHEGMPWSEWQALGQDPNSTLMTNC
jgi:hypothetical protein